MFQQPEQITAIVFNIPFQDKPHPCNHTTKTNDTSVHVLLGLNHLLQCMSQLNPVKEDAYLLRDKILRKKPHRVCNLVHD